MKKHSVFVFNLVQDTAVLWPLVRFAKQQFQEPLTFLVSAGFRKRDESGLWFKEVQQLAREMQASVLQVGTTADAAIALYGGRGIIFAGSESDLGPHQGSHDIFRAAPSTYLKVTLQHGFECVGFMHNTAHDTKYGYDIRFGADVAVGWFSPEFLYSVVDDQRQKLFIAGPTQLLMPDARAALRQPRQPSDSPMAGIVCENLHSVRLQAEETKSDFLEAFNAFSGRVGAAGGSLDLRPHPHGRYSEKNALELPRAVQMNTVPLYKQQLARFAFGISAPSSVLFDLIFAGVPVAVWQDRWNSLDISNYSGLPVIVSDRDWWDFARDAMSDPKPLVDGQNAFITRLGIPNDVRAKYATIFAASL